MQGSSIHFKDHLLWSKNFPNNQLTVTPGYSYQWIDCTGGIFILAVNSYINNKYSPLDNLARLFF